MKGTKNKSAQISRKSIDEIDIDRISSILLDGSRCKDVKGKEGWSRPQLTYMLKNVVHQLNKANNQILELTELTQAAQSAINLLKSKLPKDA